MQKLVNPRRSLLATWIKFIHCSLNGFADFFSNFFVYLPFGSEKDSIEYRRELEALRSQNMDLSKKVSVLEDTLAQLDQMTKEKNRLNGIVIDLTKQLEASRQLYDESQRQNQQNRGSFFSCPKCHEDYIYMLFFQNSCKAN
jgi:hypothetical protein